MGYLLTIFSSFLIASLSLTIFLFVNDNFLKYDIGQSVEGRNIEAYTFGKGDNHLLFVGGIHGGYEWNSVLLTYEIIDYLKENKEEIREDVKITIIPSLNPDGLYEILQKEGRFTKEEALRLDPGDGTGRLNARGVDLNRNFACNWKPESTWKSNIVSAGTEPFSEPEAKALQKFVLENKPQAVIFWHSEAGAVYGSSCEKGEMLEETEKVMNTYAEGSDYPAIASFGHYDITGDSEGWLATIGIPAITVELSTHKVVEFDKNLRGVKALIQYYKK